MKKTLFLTGIVALVLCSTSRAQMIYLQGGVNLANITKDNDGNTEDNNTLTTFNAGVMARFGLSKVIDLESGVLFTGRGSRAKSTFNGGADYVISTFRPMYIEVPLNLVAQVPLGSSAIYFNAGPYIAIGVAGKSKLQTKIGPLVSESERDIKFSNDDPFTSQQEDAAYDKLKRFDYGLNLGAGIKVSRLMLKANYGFGLAKINSTESNNSANDKNKYRTLSFSVGIPLSK